MGVMGVPWPHAQAQLFQDKDIFPNGRFLAGFPRWMSVYNDVKCVRSQHGIRSFFQLTSEAPCVCWLTVTKIWSFLRLAFLFPFYELVKHQASCWYLHSQQSPPPELNWVILFFRTAAAWHSFHLLITDLTGWFAVIVWQSCLVFSFAFIIHFPYIFVAILTHPKLECSWSSFNQHGNMTS